MRPGRTSAGSSFSGWFVVTMTMRSGESTTPSSTFKTPERSSASEESAAIKGDDRPAPPLAGPSAAVIIISSWTSGSSPPAGAAAAGRGGGAPSAFARASTTGDAASMSSRTKIAWEKARRTGQSSPTTLKRRSNMASMRSWFVTTRPSGMETTLRPVRCAMALIKEVLPVPGGPWSMMPSLRGKPRTPNFPRRSANASRSERSRGFSGKKSDLNVLDASKRYLLYVGPVADSSSSPPAAEAAFCT
mmetsp:Transcript_12620/g.42152  ORF Transcript_12620/g.42152 Transcript_12620/m.42152 type:complete len:246 (-) Transcript_12620:457-1194(-)